MRRVKFAEKAEGVGISLVERDSDMAVVVGHYQNEYQIYYILQGERFFYTEENYYWMYPGTLSFVDKKRIPYTNVIGGKYHERVLIEIEERWLSHCAGLLGLDLPALFARWHGVMALDQGQQREIEAELQSLCEAREEDRAVLHGRIKLFVMQLLLRCARGEFAPVRAHILPQGKMKRYIKVREIIDYIMLHYNEIYGLEDVAQLFYLDKTYLARIFKEVTNFTVNEFINSQRIGVARELLINPELSMEEVSKRLGYERLSYFDRVFKKYMGISPLQYRKRKQKEEKYQKPQT